MRIAIVDDVSQERSCLLHLLHLYFESRSDRYTVSPEYLEYNCGEAFLAEYVAGAFDLVLLDIYMQEMNGIELAELIAKKDKDCSIIFFTSSKEHTLEGYHVHAAGYIIKPVTDNIPALYLALDYSMERLQPDRKKICVSTEYGDINLSLQDILYFEHNNRRLYMHLINKVICLSGKYSSYKKILLSDSRFIESYRSILVNMDYISVDLECDFLLVNGERVPISRRKKSEVMLQYMRYFMTRKR